ncbi:hypothetical protein [Desulfosporosinus sp. OT]|uniref:hypothetical protein n=1 Tax=Desulfosporosinus sp. OT TaxID=913865 RepID=UPI000223A06C|nr:hypothetical protein [Desulfosporosinus sp. OT]EGW37169.1 hypothetical protein DOT_4708 [Desulfosporosinus sp. OT]
MDSINEKNFKDIQEEYIDIDERNIETLFLCISCEDVEKSKDTIKKYLGVSEKSAKYTVKDFDDQDKLQLKFWVTDGQTLDIKRLSENRFENLG